MFTQWLNPGTGRWRIVRNDQYYVDKTGMLVLLNRRINSPYRYVAVTRPRRFGKTTDKDMISAYYDLSVDGKAAFAGLEIEKDPGFDTFRNQFQVISVNMLDVLSETSPLGGIFRLSTGLLRELSETNPSVVFPHEITWEEYIVSVREHIRLRKEKGSAEMIPPASCGQMLRNALRMVYQSTGRGFVFLIDEWDAFFRKYPLLEDENAFYLDFLRDILKDMDYVALAYMTGILPIKKYGEHSALNMFDEYSMVQPLGMAPYMGFTEENVKRLCGGDEAQFSILREWYDGYLLAVPSGLRNGKENIHQIHIYGPYSVTRALFNQEIANYWNESETFKALRDAVALPFGGLRYIVSSLMQGGRQKVDIRTYQNDMTSFQQPDDVLTMLIHLGYLAYDAKTEEVFIPNRELMDEFRNAVKAIPDYHAVQEMIKNSNNMLQAIWREERSTVESCIQAVMDTVDEHSYYNEQVLIMAIRTALFAAEAYYTFFSEVPAGRGRADLIGIPRPEHANLPALLIEAKIDKSAASAIEQIRQRKYPEKLKAWKGKLIMVGANYDKTLRTSDPGYKQWTDVEIERG